MKVNNVTIPAKGCYNFLDMSLFITHYHIVPRKRPWVLAAQAPKIGSGRLHGVYQINLHRHFARASLMPAWWWRKLYRARKWTDSQPHCKPFKVFVACSMQISYCRRRTQQTSYEGYEWNLDVWCHGTWSTSEWSQLSTWAMWTYFRFTM